MSQDEYTEIFTYVVETANPSYKIYILDKSPDKPHTLGGRDRFAVELIGVDGDVLLHYDCYYFSDAYAVVARSMKEAGL